MLRNGEQLLLAVVIPVIVLVGGVNGAAPRRPPLRPPGRRRLHARRARAGGDVDVVHVAGDRHRLRAALRRDQAARLLAAPPLRAAGRQGRRPAARRGAPDRGDLARWRSLLGWDPAAAACPGAVLAVVLGTAAFAALGLFVAGVLRAEATLAAANLVYLLLLAGGAVVLPSSSYGAFGHVTAVAALRRARRRHAPGPDRRRHRLARPRRAARLGRRRHRPHRQDLHVGVSHRWLRRFAWATLVANIAAGRHRRRRPAHRLRARLPDLAALHRRLVHPARRRSGRTSDRVRQPDADLRAGRGRGGHVRRRAGSSGRRDLLRLVGGARAGDPRPGGARRHHGADRPQPVGRLVPPAAVAGDHRRSRCSSCTGSTTRPSRRRGACVPALAWTTYGVTWLVLYAGTVVTGSGPHAGDANSPRNGLDPLQLSQLHADLVFLLIGLTVGMWFALRATRRRHPTGRAPWPRSRCCRRRSASCSTSPACPSRSSCCTCWARRWSRRGDLAAGLGRASRPTGGTGHGRRSACTPVGRPTVVPVGRTSTSIGCLPARSDLRTASAGEQRVERDRHEQQRQVEVRGVEQHHRPDHAEVLGAAGARPHPVGLRPGTPRPARRPRPGRPGRCRRPARAAATSRPSPSCRRRSGGRRPRPAPPPAASGRRRRRSPRGSAAPAPRCAAASRRRRRGTARPAARPARR